MEFHSGRLRDRYKDRSNKTVQSCPYRLSVEEKSGINSTAVRSIFKGQVLPGDRYKLKALNNNITYRFDHKLLRCMPEKEVATAIENEGIVEHAMDEASEGCD